jgi:hypothetical protein
MQLAGSDWLSSCSGIPLIVHEMSAATQAEHSGPRQSDSQPQAVGHSAALKRGVSSHLSSGDSSPLQFCGWLVCITNLHIARQVIALCLHEVQLPA